MSLVKGSVGGAQWPVDIFTAGVIGDIAGYSGVERMFTVAMALGKQRSLGFFYYKILLAKAIFGCAHRADIGLAGTFFIFVLQHFIIRFYQV